MPPRPEAQAAGKTQINQAEQHPHEHHRSVGTGLLRAAVFGMSDGLVSNAALILGVAGANAGGAAVRAAGVAGLFAGSFSMATGEYLSMRAQADLLERELSIERRALRENPEHEREELQELYEKRGVPREAAEQIAVSVMADEEVALEVHAREELGIDPNELGSPIAAALSSFVAFAFGALLPLLPWIFSEGNAALIASVTIAIVAAGALGFAIAAASHRRYLASVGRHVILAAGAIGITYAIGTLFDVAT